MLMRCVIVSAVLIASASADARTSGLNFLAMGDWGGTDSKPYTEPGQVKAAAAMANVAANIGAKFALGMGDNVSAHHARTHLIEHCAQ